MKLLIIFCCIFFNARFSLAKEIVIYGLGDSITTGTNVDGFGNFLEFSWITGNSLNDSHAQKFSKLGFDVVPYNLSVPGSVAAGLSKQFEKAKTSSADYFGISIGANDVCGWTLENFEKNSNEFIKEIDRFLDKVAEKYPNARANFLPVPDVVHVKSVAGNSDYCQLVWSSSGLCSNILQERNSYKLSEYSRRIADLNARLSYFLYLKNPNLYTMPHPEIANKFELKHLSKYDCFHPSKEGQRFISDILWLETVSDL